MARKSAAEDMRLTLGVLTAAEAGGGVSQRGLSVELGVALGLVNAYVKRCVRKGLLKVSQAPARRYTYYLTPAGFAEKARLTGEYLSVSLSFFRRARDAYSDVLNEAADRGWRSVAIIGAGELAEIAMICAMEHGVEVVAIVDPEVCTASLAGAALVKSPRVIAEKVDGFVLARPALTQASFEMLMRDIGQDRLVWPQAHGLGLPMVIGGPRGR